MNRKHVMAIASKDMKLIWKSSKVWIGLIILPLIMGVIIPAAAILVGRSISMEDMNGGMGLLKLIDEIPFEGVGGPLTIHQKLISFIVNFMLPPLFMLIPVTNAMMIAVNSFVGEKESRTLESLMLAPLSIRDLFAGKLLASFIPSYAAALGSFLLCGIVVNLLAYPLFQHLVFPSMNWIVLMLWVIPAFTLTAILFSVLVSARSKSFQEAQQVAGVIVLPIVGLLIGQATGVLLISLAIMGIIGAVLMGVNLGLLAWIAKMNQRDQLFESQIQ
ncbi:ABC transporter permease subunit [Paenibacillus oenotherae]|uniref:ABC transporter permease subunit n=1 Tax=Paenibacillus oenotherae TaxID=1435645 RepID=A0ABS7D8U8_9BACL|nr:ABC transporter permease subunit [Paenibacillus oenotherae]MBW7476377.1 ABC transporter permease subunit [Paenibacillus oenotherae]